MGASELRVVVGERAGEVSALLLRPEVATSALVLGHGAGAGMRHPFMEALSVRLAERGVATLRYQFPYMEQGSRRPSPKGLLLATVRAAVASAREALSDLPILAGGKSMGGRMTSLACAEQPLAGVRGLVFVGFPLHPAGRPGRERAAHLADVKLPMLFLQGTRDRLAELELIRPLAAELAPRARLVVIEDGDHSFHPRKRSGRSDEQALDELADAVATFAAEL